jgi:hypothetical protein
MGHCNKLHSISSQNHIFHIILCWRKIYRDLPWRRRKSESVGIVEPVEVVIARQRNDKHACAASGTDATIGDVVFSLRPFVAKALYTHFHRSESTHNTLEEVFPVCPCRGYILRTSIQLWAARAANGRWHLVVGHEESPLLAAKNCNRQSLRNISCSKRNHGECFVLVWTRRTVFVFSPWFINPEKPNFLTRLSYFSYSRWSLFHGWL